MVALFALLLSAAIQESTSFESVIGGTDIDRGIAVIATADGGYGAVGFTTSFGAGGEDVYFVRTDASGELLWSQTFGGPGADNGWAIIEQADQFVIAGFTESFGAGGFDCYLIGTNLDGSMRWSATLGGHRKDRCWGALATEDGGFVLVGETTSSGAGDDDCYLVKTDAAGAEIWSRTFGGPEGDRCFSIAEADDGGFLLAGQTYSFGAGDRDSYVIRTDPAGDLVWSKTFGGADSDVGHSITANRDGTFLVTGYTSSFAVAEEAPYVIRLDAEGDVRWERVIPMEGVKNRTLSGEETVDGGFILGGFSESGGVRSALLVKTDAHGYAEEVSNILPTTSGTSVGYTVRATAEGGSVLTGHTTRGAAGEVDLLIVKSD